MFLHTMKGRRMAEYDKSLEYISSTQTLIGQQKRELVDRQTGEIIWVDQITKRTYGTKNFWKCYLRVGGDSNTW